MDNIKCQTCGEFGGRTLSYSSKEGIVASRWCCPHCCNTIEEALRKIACMVDITKKVRERNG